DDYSILSASLRVHPRLKTGLRQKAASPLARAGGRPRLANVEWLLRHRQKSVAAEVCVQIVAHDRAVVGNALRATGPGAERTHRHQRRKRLRAFIFVGFRITREKSLPGIAAHQLAVS